MIIRFREATMAVRIARGAFVQKALTNHQRGMLINAIASLQGVGAFTLALAILCIIGALDCFMPVEVSFAVFYLLPVCVAAWGCGLWPGVLISLLSAITWEVASRIGGLQHASVWVDVWNPASRFVFYALICYLLDYKRRADRQLALLATTDPLTGLANRRLLIDRLTADIARQSRTGKPLSLAFIDIDHFKALNDSHGHETGDQALRLVAGLLTAELRKVDTVARIGGDEFALVLAETNRIDADLTLCRLRQTLLDAMRERGWPVTFSVGVTHGLATIDAETWLATADQLMYEVKRAGRNAIQSREIGASA